MMTNIYEISKNIALILFPFLCYTIYIAYCNEINKKESNIILSLVIFISMYICYRNVTVNTMLPLMLDVPLLIAYVKNKKDCIILMSILIIIIYHVSYGTSLYLSIIEYAVYFVVIFCTNSNKKNINVIVFCLLKSTTYIIQTLYLNNTIVITNILTILEFIISSIVIVYLIDRSDKIINLNLSIKELEKELQMRKSLFNIAHEIKNPLSVCKGYLEMIDFNNSSHEKYITIIQNELNRSITLMNDMLHINQIKINPDYMDVNLLLEDIKMCIEPLIEKNNISVSIDISKDDIYIYADYTRIKQVFIDIIKSSVESLTHIKHNKFININVRLKNNKIITTIKDNGTSTSNRELSELSKSYYISDSKNKALGMTLANEIIKCHNGKIEYKSFYKRGNLTKITLPSC